jgi:flagellar motor switch protein FliG
VGNPEEEDIITEADVLEILQRLRSGLQQHYEQHVQSIVRQVSGLSAVSESQLQQAVQHEMERKLSELQCQLLHEYEMDRDCLEDAIRDLQVESMAVQAAVQDFEKSWSCLLSSSSTTED